jgi:hypothetical protein
MKIILTIEAELSVDEIYDTETLSQDLLDEMVKVKSGPYENVLIGYISNVQTTPRKPNEG